jgi:hypothetical protein
MQHIEDTQNIVKSRAARLLLQLTLSAGVVLFQQSAGAQTPQALPLPTAERGAQSIGQISTQQRTLPAGASVLQPSVMVVGSYSGSVAGAPVTSGPFRLSMADAVKRGLQTNLGVITSDTVSSTVRAQRMQVLSQMLPQIGASVGESVMQLNLSS